MIWRVTTERLYGRHAVRVELLRDGAVIARQSMLAGLAMVPHIKRWILERGE